MESLARFIIATPGFHRLASVKERSLCREKSGSGALGLAYRNLNTWRSFRARPVSVATVDRSRAPLHVLSMDNDARMIRLPFTKH